MRKLVFSMNVSLDGCADHRVALADDELHDFATRLLETEDMLLFGRGIYQLFVDYWPHARQDPQATTSMLAFADRINAIPKVVFSSTLEKVDWSNTRLVGTDMLAEVKRLKQEAGGRLAVGGLRMIQSCWQAGLIDEYWLLVHPLLWGPGRRLFENVPNAAAGELVDVSTFRSGVAVLHYAIH